MGFRLKAFSVAHMLDEPCIKGIIGRAIWVFIVVSSIGVAAFFISVSVSDFFSSTGNS